MSFTKTISVFAALASIFAAGVTGWKLADSQKDVPPSDLDQKIMELEKKLEEATTPKPVQQVVQPQVIAPPPPAILPSVTPPPPVPTEE